MQGHNVDLCVIPDDWKKAQKEFKNYDEAADQKVRNICSIGSNYKLLVVFWS